MSKETGLTGGKETAASIVLTEHVSLTSKYGFHYPTPRDLVLVYRQKPLDKPVLTVEHYCKWYTLYLVMPDGTVKSVHDDFRDEYDDAVEHWGSTHMCDHCYHPDFIPVLAHHLGAYVDSEAHEMIAGRWVIEATEKYQPSGYGFDDKAELDDWIARTQGRNAT